MTTKEISAQPPTLSVSELSTLIKKNIETNFSRVRIQGEVSGLKRHTSGHSYFSIKDKDAVLDAVCWRGTPLKAALSEGMDAIFTGRITVYTGRSKYQMVVDSVELAGEGALLKLLLERKEALKKEGLFDRKKPLPAFPCRIGIITSPTGAVIRDILHRLGERFPCHVLVWPVLVQGPGASDQITAAVLGFNNLPEEERPDLLIIARGGGSIEDLWAFNEENVVRATSASLIPTISAIGHETDTTLIDFASDLRAPTPTAAAELATPALNQLLINLNTMAERLYFLSRRFLHAHTLKIERYGPHILDPRNYLDTLMLRLDDWCERLRKAPMTLLSHFGHMLLFLSKRIRSPLPLLERGESHFENLSERLNASLLRYLEAKNRLLEQYQFFLTQASPQKTLERGYCWIQHDKTIIKTAKAFEEILPISATCYFADGKVSVQVSK